VNIKKTFLLLALIITASAGILTTPIHAADPTADDLVAAVNAYRAANGYYVMNPHPLVYQAAQTHAQWIVDTGQGGHIGAGGSNETTRVSWTGYGGGAEILCDENWSSGRTVEDAVYGAWADWVHQEVMLNQWGNLYTDIGGGVAAKGDGSFVMVLNVCKVYGQEATGDVPEAGSPPPSGALPTTDFSNYVYSVVTATPQPDGSVTHVVQYGQTLLTIAEAYGITVEQLRELNGFAADFTAIWPDDELVIIKGTGETAPTAPTAPAAEETPEATLTPTLTPRPTYTPSSMELTAAANAASGTETVTEEETQPTRSSLTAGMFLLIFAGLGLVAMVFITSTKKDTPPPDEDILGDGSG
jgi:LysM repeat protein